MLLKPLFNTDTDSVGYSGRRFEYKHRCISSSTTAPAMVLGQNSDVSARGLTSFLYCGCAFQFLFFHQAQSILPIHCSDKLTTIGTCVEKTANIDARYPSCVKDINECFRNALCRILSRMKEVGLKFKNNVLAKLCQKQTKAERQEGILQSGVTA